MRGKRRGKKESAGGTAGQERSEAVASVIALMLLLAVIATFIGLYSTEYLPSLKEQSEIEKVSEIKEAFMGFSGDISHIVSDKNRASYSHMIPLGAGDVIMSPEKSSGTLSVSNATIFKICNSGSGSPVASSGMVKVEYKPSYSFWEGQGYNWQYGYINVTKKGIEVPLEYYTMDDLIGSGEFSTFARSFIEVEPDEAGGNLTLLEIDVVSLFLGDNNFISGNGAATLKILAEDPKKDVVSFNTSDLQFSFENSTTGGIMPEFSSHIFEKAVSSLEELKDYDNVENVETDLSSSGDTITLQMTSPVLISIRPVEIEISVS